MISFKKTILGIGCSVFLFSSCDNGFDDMNISPNNPEVAPTYTIFNASTRRLMNFTRDGWVSGRMVLPWVQYSAQRNYVDEDKYLYRPSTGDRAWNNIYRSIHNFKKIIDLCTDPLIRDQMEEYGDLESQIGVARIMLAYSFGELANYFGDVPYWSYSGKDNANFQALDIDRFPQPQYLSQQEIFQNLLLELKEAEAQIDSKASVFSSRAGLIGDKIYDGNASQWKKLANSLRLRIANQIKDVDPSARSHINEALNNGVFTSNSDNAAQSYGLSSIEGSPFWSEFFTGTPRDDFFINNQFVKLLKGVSGNYGKDPRLVKFAAPMGTPKSLIATGGYEEAEDYAQYQGMPYGLPNNRLIHNNAFSKISFFSSHILKPNYGEMIMEYAEVEFILSELNGWSDEHYRKGVKASMEKWGVDEEKVNEYMNALPNANKEHVMTQKYIALFMQPQAAWVDYRRTGFPDDSILLLPNQTGYELDGTPYIFISLVDGMVDLPYRIAYPVTEQTLNRRSWTAAVEKYGGSDPINAKLWWMP